VRFLLTGDDPTGSVAAFELAVPAAQHLAAPAHSHDHDERRHGLAGSAPASDVALLPPMQDVNINDECGIDAFRQSSAE
jgi:hypothetical protein